MSKLIIRAAYADMIAPFQSSGDGRYYLTGFNVQPHPQGGVTLVATDGHTMGVFHESEGQVEAGGDIWALSKETLKACKPKARDDLARWLVILPRTEGVTHDVTVVFADSAETAEYVSASGAADLILHQSMVAPIDGEFPDYERVVPTDAFDTPKAPGAYNGEYLAKFTRVAGYDFEGGDLHKAIRLHAADVTKPAVALTHRADFFGVIMPVKAETHSCLPAWWTERGGDVEKAA